MASLSNYPNVRPSLFLDFANSGMVDPRLAFTRATTATRVNARGLMETVAANVPRINYDAFTGECLGILNEVSRTNSAIYSGNALDASWLFVGGSRSGGQLSTFGNNSAVKFTGPSSGAPYKNAIATSTSVCCSIAVKQSGARASATFLLRNGTTGINFNGGVLNFATGVISGLGWSVKPGPEGFFIVSYVQTSGISIGDTLTFYYGEISAAPANFEIITDWMQIEGGAFPTSYIPTAASAVTRAAENLVIAGANFLDIFNQAQGTMYVEGVQDGNYGGWFAGVSSGTASDRTGVYMSGSQVRGVAFVGAAVQANLSVNVPDVGQIRKAAFALQKDNFAMSVNGGAAVTSGQGTMPIVTQMTIGNAPWGATESFCGHIKRIAYYPARLSNAQLQSLTAL